MPYDTGTLTSCFVLAANMCAGWNMLWISDLLSLLYSSAIIVHSSFFVMDSHFISTDPLLPSAALVQLVKGLWLQGFFFAIIFTVRCTAMVSRPSVCPRHRCTLIIVLNFLKIITTQTLASASGFCYQVVKMRQSASRVSSQNSTVE